MKLTWFGGTAVRILIGDAILVIDAEKAPADVDRAELLSGADRVIATGAPANVDLLTWKPRKLARPLDEAGTQAPDIWSAGAGVLLVDAPGEPPLLLFPQEVSHLGRWADNAVIALGGDLEQVVSVGLTLLANRPPRLILLAADDATLDDAIPQLRPHLDDTGLIALQPGMAVEV
jgi:hypothetical protein